MVGGIEGVIVSGIEGVIVSGIVSVVCATSQPTHLMH